VVKTDETVSKLTQIGFSSYEAKVYFALLQKHPAIGYEIAKNARIPTAKIYEVLTTLRSKGVVMASSTEPVCYSPIPPEQLLRRLEQDYSAKIADLDLRLQQVQPLPEADITWHLNGYQTVIDKMADVINNSEHSLLLSVWPDEADLLRELVKKAESKGVKVIAGIFGCCDLGWKHTVNLEQCGVTSLLRLRKRLTVVVGDNKEVVISEIGSPEDTVGIWTTTPGIVLVAKEYIKHDLWGRALIDSVGEDKFRRLCEDSAVLTYLIKNR